MHFNSSKNNIYTLSELIDNNLDLGEIDALAEKNYSIRIWLTNTSEVNISKNLHYHGIIQVIENETDLAVR